MPVRCSVRLRRSISARRRNASAAVAQAAGRLANAGGQASRPGSIAGRSRSPGRPREPPRGACRRPRGSGPARSSRSAVGVCVAVQLLAQCLDPRGQPAGRLVVLDPRLQHGRLSPRPSRPAWPRRPAGPRRRRTARADARNSASFSPQVEVVLLERDGLGQRRDRLLDIAEAGQHLGQPGQVLGVPVGPVGDLGPGGLGLVGPLELVQVFAEIFAILGVVGRQLDGLACRGPGRRRPSRPAATGRRPARSSPGRSAWPRAASARWPRRPPCARAAALVVSRKTRAPQSRSVSGLLGSAWSRASYCAAASAYFWSWASWQIRPAASRGESGPA